MNQELPIIDFSCNWNGKLGCNVFTVIKMRDDSIFKPGALFMQTLKFDPIGIVEILDIKHFTLNQFNDFMAFLDFGVNRKEAIKLIYEQFNTNATNPDQEFSYILLRRKKNTTDETQN